MKKLSASVAPIVTFSDIDEAIKLANDTPFGLAAYFFTENYRRGIYISEQLEYGIIGWNDGGRPQFKRRSEE